MIEKLIQSFREIGHAREQAYEKGSTYASLLNTIGFRLYHVWHSSRSTATLQNAQREQRRILEGIAQTYKGFDFIERIFFKKAIKDSLGKQEEYRKYVPSYDRVSALFN